MSSNNSRKTGTSGNPAGRKPGSGSIGKLREGIAKDVPAIIQSLTTAAIDGDVGAAKLLLERALPPLKPAEESVIVALNQTDSMADQGRAVLVAIAAGQVTPGQGTALLAAIGSLAKMVEVDELMRRIEALEKANGET